MKKLQQVLLLITIFTLSHVSSFAIDDPGGELDVPIDGGLSLLVAAGVGYGAKQLRKKKTNAR